MEMTVDAKAEAVISNPTHNLMLARFLASGKFIGQPAQVVLIGHYTTIFRRQKTSAGARNTSAIKVAESPLISRHKKRRPRTSLIVNLVGRGNLK